LNEPTNNATDTAEQPAGSFLQREVAVPQWAYGVVIPAITHVLVTLFAPDHMSRLLTLIAFTIIAMVVAVAMLIRRLAFPVGEHENRTAPLTRVARFAWKKTGTDKVWRLISLGTLFLVAMSLQLVP